MGIDADLYDRQCWDREREAILDVLQDVLEQCCGKYIGDGIYRLDSMAISAYSDGIRKLADYGRVELECDAFRRTIGKTIKPLD